MELFVQELGSEGTPLFVIHGLFGLSDNWRTFGLRWQDKYRVLLADARNHGRSPWAETHTYPDMAQDILDTLDAKGIEQAILLGHSMGGKAVMELALNHPDRVKALIVADMAPRAYPQHHEAILMALHAVQIDTLTSRQEAEAQMAPHLDDVGMRQFLLKSLYRTEAGGFALRFNLRVLTKDYDRILDGVNGIPYQGPTFFISGGNSRYVQDKDHPLIEQFFPSVQYHVLDGAGHWLHAEQPNLFGLAVEGFLAQLD